MTPLFQFNFIFKRGTRCFFSHCNCSVSSSRCVAKFEPGTFFPGNRQVRLYPLAKPYATTLQHLTSYFNHALGYMFAGCLAQVALHIELRLTHHFSNAATQQFSYASRGNLATPSPTRSLRFTLQFIYASPHRIPTLRLTTKPNIALPHNMAMPYTTTYSVALRFTLHLRNASSHDSNPSQTRTLEIQVQWVNEQILKSRKWRSSLVGYRFLGCSTVQRRVYYFFPKLCHPSGILNSAELDNVECILFSVSPVKGTLFFLISSDRDPDRILVHRLVLPHHSNLGEKY